MSGHSVRRGSILVNTAVAGIVTLSGCSTDETAVPTSASQIDEEATTITTTTTVGDGGESANTPNPDVDGNDADESSSTPTREEASEEMIADLNSIEGGNGSGWTVTDNTNWDTTSGLTFTSTVQNKITHSATFGIVLLSHKGEYVGTAGGLQIINSVGDGGRTMTVNFFGVNEMTEDGGTFAFRGQYNAPVMYSWDGSEAAQKDEIPKAEGS